MCVCVCVSKGALTAILEEKSGVGVMGMVPRLPPENFDSRLFWTLSEGEGIEVSYGRMGDVYILVY